MHYNNPNSKRKNIFRNVYDNEQFKNILNNKNNLPEFPFLIDVELTNCCNLSCIFCGQQAMTRKKGLMSWESFEKIVEECAKYNTPIRLIRWGEPFLHQDIIEYCEYVKSKGLPLHITNNGQAITESQMKALVDIGLDSLVFSFQGATKEQYEIMRNNNNYDLLKSNVLKMVEIRGEKEKPFIHVSSTVTDESKDEIHEFIQYWGNIVDSVGIGKTNLSNLSPDQIKKFEVVDKLEELKKQETIRKEYRPCTEIYQKLSVDWDGKISCCCGDYDNFMTIGSIQDTSLYDIWNNSEELHGYRVLLNNLRHKSLQLCSKCYATYDDFL